jgi:hypothetical protein
MADIHNKSFFGTNVGMILDSTSMTEQTLFLTFIRKKQDGSWEKPSLKEGKKVNFNLEELVWILEVLKNYVPEWSTVHKFEDTTTKISVSRVKDAKEQEKVCIQVNGYKKFLNYAESIVLTKLLDHILEEKIIYSTIPHQPSGKNGEEIVNLNNINIKKAEEEGEKRNIPVAVEEVVPVKTKGKKVKEKKEDEQDKVKETHTISGSIQAETEKALRIMFESGKELWIPKSTMHSLYKADSDALQTFEIDAWILKKNELIQ